MYDLNIYIWPACTHTHVHAHAQTRSRARMRTYASTYLAKAYSHTSSFLRMYGHVDIVSSLKFLHRDCVCCKHLRNPGNLRLSLPPLSLLSCFQSASQHPTYNLLVSPEPIISPTFDVVQLPYRCLRQTARVDMIKEYSRRFIEYVGAH